MINPEIWAENSKNFNEIDDLFHPENVKQMLDMCACCMHMLHLMCHEFLNEPREYVFLDGVLVPNIWYPAAPYCGA